MNDRDLKEKRVAGKKTAMRLRKSLDIPPPLKVIRHKCKDCCGGSLIDVKNCGSEGCPLWPFRFGRSPRQDDLKVLEIDQYGKALGYHDYPGYRAEM